MGCIRYSTLILYYYWTGTLRRVSTKCIYFHHTKNAGMQSRCGNHPHCYIHEASGSYYNFLCARICNMQRTARRGEGGRPEAERAWHTHPKTMLNSTKRNRAQISKHTRIV